MSDRVLCKDCVHSFVPLKDWLFAFGENKSLYTLCKKAYVEPTTDFDSVIGPVKRDGYYRRAILERTPGFKPENRCGEQGQYWTPKDKKHLFTYIKRIEQ